MTAALVAGSQLQQYLRSLGSEQLLFHPNPGNAGDSVIAHATFELFRNLGINFRVFRERDFQPEKSIVVYGGGGNLTIYHHARSFLFKYHRNAKRLIVLPHTIWHNEDVLSDLGTNVDILCREKVSFEHAKMHARKANVLLMEDVAFELDLEKILQVTPGVPPTVLSRRLLRENWRNSARLMLSRFETNDSTERSGLLNAFRTDEERSRIPIPAGNIDVSKKFGYGTQDPEICMFSATRMIQFLNRHEEIRTNRLHVGIVGAMLNKQVRLYSNSYFKCKAVYDHSLRERYPNVQWMG